MNGIKQYGCTACKVIKCMVLNNMAAQRVRSSNVWHFTI